MSFKAYPILKCAEDLDFVNSGEKAYIADKLVTIEYIVFDTIVGFSGEDGKITEVNFFPKSFIEKMPKLEELKEVSLEELR